MNCKCKLELRKQYRIKPGYPNEGATVTIDADYPGELMVDVSVYHAKLGIWTRDTVEADTLEDHPGYRYEVRGFEGHIASLNTLDEAWRYCVAICEKMVDKDTLLMNIDYMRSYVAGWTHVHPIYRTPEDADSVVYIVLVEQPPHPAG